MARYVDIDKRYKVFIDETHINVMSLDEILKALPHTETDVVEVVRCKDCMHKFDDGNQIICKKLYWCDTINFEPSAEDFCSLGERSEL